MKKGISPLISVFIIIAILTILGLGIYFVSRAPAKEAIIQELPSDCTYKDSGENYQTFICVNDVCKIQGEATCDEATQEDLVIFRGEEQASFPSQLAIDSDGDGDLDAWKRTSGSTSQSICFRDNLRIGEGFLNSWAIFYNNGIVMCTNDDNAKYTKSGATITTSSSPTEPYKSSGREIYSGTGNNYQCAFDLKINGEIIETAVYSSNRPSGERAITTDEYLIQSRDNVQFDGYIVTDNYECGCEDPFQCSVDSEPFCSADGTQKVTCDLTDPPCGYWDYTDAPEHQKCVNGDFVCEDECSTSECDSDISYLECLRDNNGCRYLGSESIECLENEFCTDGECGALYTIILTLDKTVLGTDESITGELRLEGTNQKNQILFRITIKDKSGRTVDSEEFFTNERGRRVFVLDPIIEIGDYTLTAEVSHPDGGQEKTVSFEIVPQLILNLFPEPDFIQFTNNPITIRAEVKSGTEYEAVAQWLVDARLKGNSVQYDISPIAKGRVFISSEVSQEGNLDFTVSAVDESGFETEEKTIRITVKKADIIIPIDISNANNQDTGIYAIKFRTLTPDNQLLNTDSNNKVTITLPNGCVSGEYCVAKNQEIPTPIVQGTNGEYSFSWNFEDSGRYVVEISSFAEGYELSEAVPTAVNIREKTIEQDTLPIVWIIIILMVAIIGIVLIVYFIKRRRRKG